jgi:phosphate transport system substrate-binding protein
MTFFMAYLLAIAFLTSCKSTNINGQAGPLNMSVTVISREDGSGTRGAFVDLFDILDKSGYDMITDRAEITNSTSVVMMSISGDPNAIGYISMGSLNDTVKAAKIDGVEATVENINNGTYTISRPFIIATNKETDALTEDFIAYIMSENGQNIVSDSGYIRVADTGPFTFVNPSGKIIVAGSSSVTPVMEKLIEAYLDINTEAEIELQTSDSSTGMNNTKDGVCDIGMSSRELKQSEIESGLVPVRIAMDGIAVIINKDNNIDALTKEQVKKIFTGELDNWSIIK